MLALSVPALVGCDKLAPLKSAKAKLDKLKEAKQEATPAAPGSISSVPVSDAKPVTAPAAQAVAKPEAEQFSKGWLPPGMSRGDVKQPQSNQRPKPAQRP